MDLSFPYARYVCPCSDTSSATPPDDRPFNPHDPRAQFALYPIDHLLYCTECDQPRCPRCWTEEVTYWYCPSCQFEVPSSGVKSDGNRCTRHCYDCPICAASLATTAVKAQSDVHLKPDDSSPSEYYILQCHSCSWTTLDIDVRFNRPTKITEQLNKLWRERTMTAVKDSEDKVIAEDETLSHVSAFANLSTFYKDQLSEASDHSGLYSNTPYSSPANLARIMSLYGGLSYNALKKSKGKPQPMREAKSKAEGLVTYTAKEDRSDEGGILNKLATLGLDATTTTSQRLASPRNYTARFVDELWPVATRLRTRKGRRCKTCRQILVRPEPKVGSMRFKIRLLAVNYIQRLSVRPLASPGPVQSAAFHLRAEAPEQITLRPHQTHHYILTVRNPVFETVKVTLGTPAVTPGAVASRVTILCPSFTVGPAGDMWDEALSSTSATAADGSRRAAMESLTGSADGDRQPEAGKIWERSRNSTSVILEIVPGALTPRPPPGIVPKTEQEEDEEHRSLAEDDNVLEIPIYVRAEWEADAHESEALHASSVSGGGDGKKRERVPKELAYWCVLGIGRIAGG